MGEKPGLLEITGQQLAAFRRCRFVHRVFRPRDCYRTVEPPVEMEAFLQEWYARGDGLLEDPARFEVVEGGWAHEHCDICWAKIMDGAAYWPNTNEEVGEIDLCEECYPRVMELLRAGRQEESAAE